MKSFLAAFLTASCFALSLAAAEPKLTNPVSSTADAVSIADQTGREILRYQRVKPSTGAASAESACYFHPLTTPSGKVVTEVGPADHKHHRGVFLAFVEMHGAKDADFWGWGEHAPTKNRRIESERIVRVDWKNNRSGFKAESAWKADDTILIDEDLTAQLTVSKDVHVLDLTYELEPQSDLTLTRWAFSGFCTRVIKEGKIEMFSPKGRVDLPNPSHVKPETDWQNEPWYAAQITLPDGSKIGAAVLNHEKNPPTLWHNHRDVRMINPCIVAPSELKLRKGKELTLRYKVVTFDGEVPVKTLNQLARRW